MPINEAELRKTVQNVLASLKSDKSKMTLAFAERLCNAVFSEAENLGVRAVVCISDGGGHPKLVKSMDGAYIASYDIAVNKAFTSVSLKMSTQTLKPLAQPGNSLYGIQFTNGGRIVIFGGGEPLVNENGDIIGGIGVSGGSEEQDTALATFGKSYFEDNM